jgi:hypothetical protein
MKTLNQILLATVAVVGSASMAHAGYAVTGVTLGNSTVGDSSYSPGSQVGISGVSGPVNAGTLGNPLNAGSTLPTTIYGETTFDVAVGAGVGPGFGPGRLNFQVNDVYEIPSFNSALGDNYFQINNITAVGLTGSYDSGNTEWRTTLGDNVPGTGNYNITVDWSITGVFNQYPNWASVFDLNTTESISASGSSVDANAYISAVPEPSQAIAGITLLGCGGLVFLGRRFVMKKA